MNIDQFIAKACLILFLIHPSYQLFAQKSSMDANPATIFELLSESEELTIITDLSYLINERSEADYIPAQIILPNDNVLELKINSRGKFRRRICEFPPIKLKFSKDNLEEMGLAKHNKLKLVTHCIENDKFVGNDNVMKEYMAYKIYNELNDNSFKVKAFKITYQDSEGVIKKIKRYGFLIEETDEMAERLGGEECEDCLNSAYEVIAKKDEAKMALFQYMIGNEDWSTQLARNVKIVQLPTGMRLPVPYDFDFSGLVNTSYAVPNSDFGLLSIQERYYLGLPIDTMVMDEVIQEFKMKQDAILKLVKGFKLVSLEERIKCLNYLKTFYNQLDSFYETAPGLNNGDTYHSFIEEGNK